MYRMYFRNSHYPSKEICDIIILCSYVKSAPVNTVIHAHVGVDTITCGYKSANWIRMNCLTGLVHLSTLSLSGSMIQIVKGRNTKQKTSAIAIGFSAVTI